MTVDAADIIDAVTAEAVVSRSYVIDALVRHLGPEKVLELVVERKTADGDARAAWSRSGR